MVGDRQPAAADQVIDLPVGGNPAREHRVGELFNGAEGVFTPGGVAQFELRHGKSLVMDPQYQLATTGPIRVKA